MKKWLERNRVYFDTFGATIPAVAAVVISLVALYVSIDGRDEVRRQSKELEHQNRVTEKLNRPVFVTLMDPQINDQGALVGASHKIRNDGALVHDLRLSVADFLVVECGKSGKGVWEEAVPVKNYFRFKFATGNPVGDLVRLVPRDNFQKLNRLYDKGRNFNGRGTEYAVPSVESLVSLAYETAFGTKEVAHFLFRAGSGGERLAEKGATEWLSSWNDKVKSNQDIRWFDTIESVDLQRICGYVK